MLLHEIISKCGNNPIRRKCWGSDEKIYIKDENFYGTAKNKSEVGYPVIIPVQYITATDWEVCSPFLSQMKKGQKFSFLDEKRERFTRVFPVMPIYHVNGQEIKYVYCGEDNVLYYTNDDFPVMLVKD